MVSAKSGATQKPTTTAKTAPKATPAIKPETSATPKPDFKAAAASDKPEPTTSAEPKPGTVPAPEVALKAEPNTPKLQAEDEKLGLKIRNKSAMLAALRSGGTLLLTPGGLYRIVNPDGSQNRASKRRAAAFVGQGLVRLTKTDAAGKHFAFDPEAEKADAKKAEAKSEPKAESGDAPKTDNSKGTA
jgi:hypothetical protein